MYFSLVNWPISVGSGASIRLPASSLRREGRSRGAPSVGDAGDSHGLQLRELADLGRDRAGDLVEFEGPCDARGVARRTGRRGRGGTRSHVSAASWPISVGIGPVIAQL